MESLILVLHIVVCVLLVILVLLQSGKEGMGVIFGGGGNSSVFGSAGEYEKALGLVAPAFNAAGASEVIDKHAFEDYCSRVNEKLPRCKHLFIALRNVITSEHHVMAGVLWSGGKLYTTRIYEVNNVIDSMGVGDAFVGAMLYAYQNYADDQAKLDFATAGSVLKNTIVGDYNMVTVNEVEAVIRGGSAEMKR